MINNTIKFSSFFVIFLGLFSKGNRKHFLRVPREGLGELEKAVETLACGSCSHSISRSPKPALVFLKLDRNTENVFYFLKDGNTGMSWMFLWLNG